MRRQCTVIESTPVGLMTRFPGSVSVPALGSVLNSAAEAGLWVGELNDAGRKPYRRAAGHHPRSELRRCR